MIMKSIIVPTDFSYASFNAARYAVRLSAQLSNCDVVLYHSVDPPPGRNTTLPLHANAADEMLEAKMRMLDLEDYLECFRPEGTRLSSVIDRHELTQGIELLARQVQAGMVVITNKAHTVAHKLIFGDSLSALIDRLSLPMLFLPYSYTYETIGMTVLAYLKGSNPPEEFIQGLVESLGSTLGILSVLPEGPDEGAKNRRRQSGLTIKRADAGFHTMHNRQISRSIARFAEEKKAGLVVTVHQKHGIFHRLFKEGTSRGVLAMAKVPVLVLPEERSN